MGACDRVGRGGFDRHAGFGAAGGVKLKSSWLAKFLSATGVKQDGPAMPDFEVLLPGKKT